jgi:hypothetical protein
MRDKQVLHNWKNINNKERNNPLVKNQFFINKLMKKKGEI